MFSQDTKLRLVHAVSDQFVADEVEKRIFALQVAPASAEEATALLASFNHKLDDKIKAHLTSGYCESGFTKAYEILSVKVIAIKKILSKFVSGITAAIASVFTGQVAGMTTDVTITADVAGLAGDITLVQDGSDIDALIAAWNLANAANTVTLTAGDGSQIPTANITLAGGADEVPATLTAEKAEYSSKSLDEETKVESVVSLAKEEAGKELFEAIELVDSVVAGL